MGRAIGRIVGHKAYIKAEGLWSGQKPNPDQDPDERGSH